MMMVACYPLAVALRQLLPPSHSSTNLRCFYCVLCGMIISLICFGWVQTAILFGIVVVSYLQLLLLPPTVVQR